MSEETITLNELFARDPLSLTCDWDKSVLMSDIFTTDPILLARYQAIAHGQGKRGPIDTIITRYRAANAQFNLGGVKSAGATKKVEKIDLDELDLG